ncbi:MAG: DUF2520 domain-containing protein [Nitrospirota bacterium]
MKAIKSNKKRVAIIGAGVVGSAVGYILRNKGYKIAGIASRRPESAKRAAAFIGNGTVFKDPVSAAKAADIVFITTPDKAIEDVCNKIADGGGFKRNTIVVHMSGALPSTILSSAKTSGAKTVSIHPLQSFADPKEAVFRMQGAFIGIEGDKDAVTDAKKIARDLGGKEFLIPLKNKAMYHAGAVVVSNYLVAIIDLGLKIYEAVGIPKETALQALLPLIKGTISNIEKLGVPGALTGPFARGDVSVVEMHIDEMRKSLPQMFRLFTELGRHTVRVGSEKGTLSKDDAERLINALTRKVVFLNPLQNIKVRPRTSRGGYGL